MGLRGWSRAGLLVRLHLVEGLSVQLCRASSARPHFRRDEVSAHLHTAEEAPLVNFAGVEVLSGDFMEVEAEGDSVEVGAEVGEVTAKPHGLFPINYPDQ